MAYPSKTKLGAFMVASVALLDFSAAFAQVQEPPSIVDACGSRKSQLGAARHCRRRRHLGERPMTRDARRILEALQINLPPGATPGPVQDTVVALSSSTSTQIAIPIGGTRTVTLPGAFDRAVLVVPEVADVIPMTPGRVQVLARQAGSSDVIFTNSRTGETFRGTIVVSINPMPVQNALNAALPGRAHPGLHGTVNGTLLLRGSTRDPQAATPGDCDRTPLCGRSSGGDQPGPGAGWSAGDASSSGG